MIFLQYFKVVKSQLCLHKDELRPKNLAVLIHHENLFDSSLID